MLTKPLLAVIIATCGAAPSVSASTQPPEYQPPLEQPQEKDHYFCCSELDDKGFSGNGCTEIPESSVVACNKVLYCDGKYKKNDDKVTCD
jgi:hypothetical protein